MSGSGQGRRSPYEGERRAAAAVMKIAPDTLPDAVLALNGREYRLVFGRVVITLAADDCEVPVELNVFKAAILKHDLNLVVALLIVNFGLVDTAAAGVLKRSGGCPL